MGLSSNTAPKVAVIGGGPAGLATAYALSQAGVSVEVFEASGSLGGMSKTLTLWGQRVDLGPHHFLSQSPQVNDLWAHLLGQDYVLLDRLTRIYYDQQFFNYPLEPLQALGTLGPLEAVHCLLSYMAQWPQPIPTQGSFQDWMVKQFGHRLFELFFKSYSEKLWGLPCHRLDASFAQQRIKSLNLWEIVKEGFLKPDHSLNRSLVTSFIYPTHGAGMLYDRMAQVIKANGGQIYLNSKVKQLHWHPDQNRVSGLTLASGHDMAFDHIVSSMPLTTLISALGDVPQAIMAHARQLQFRNTTLVYLNIDDPALFPDHWLYIHRPDLMMGRITNFRNWSPALYGEATSSILCLEYWSSDHDVLWHEPDDHLILRGIRELKATGLIGRAEILGGSVHRVHRCYPIYELGYQAHLLPLQRFLMPLQNLHVIGRYGSFKYNNQDHSILMGLRAAENILHQTDHNLWELNHNQYSTNASSSVPITTHPLYHRTTVDALTV